MYDELGQLAWKMQLDVFGVASIEEGSADDCPWRWPGQYEDEGTGLYYNRWRWYSPEIGSYQSQDPLALQGGPQLFGYVASPVGAIDPLGLISLDAGGYTLYHIIESTTGRVAYVGITNNPAIREAQHRASGRLGEGFEMRAVNDNLLYGQARGYEQADIAFFGTRQTNRIAQPMVAGEPNRIWSYDPRRTDARASVFREHERIRASMHGGCR